MTLNSLLKFFIVSVFCVSWVDALSARDEINIQSIGEVEMSSLCGYLEADDDQTFEAIIESSLFSALNELSFEPHKSYWVSCKISNSTIQEEWAVIIPFQTTTDGELYIISNDSITKGPYQLGIFEPRTDNAAYQTIGAKEIFQPIHLTQNEEYRILLRLENEKKGLSISPHISIRPYNKAFLQDQISKYIWISIFTGWVIIFIFIAFILYLSTKDKSNYYYGLYLFSMLIWASFSNGLFREWCMNYLTGIPPQYLSLIHI